MNQDILSGNWKQMKGKVKEQWAKLTNEDLDIAVNVRDQLLAKIQARYGVAREEAERQLREFEHRFAGHTAAGA